MKITILILILNHFMYNNFDFDFKIFLVPDFTDFMFQNLQNHWAFDITQRYHHLQL